MRTLNLLTLAALLTASLGASPPPSPTSSPSPTDPVATGPLTDPTQIRDFAAHAHTLSEAALLQLYQATALAVGVSDAPLDNPITFTSDEHCYLLREEILRRGAPIVPLVTDALKMEITIHRPKKPNGLSPGLIGAEFDLLSALGEPSAVPALLDILATGPPLDAYILNNVNRSVLALVGIEKLTFISFRHTDPDYTNFDAIPSPDALPLDHSKSHDIQPIVTLYRAWLAGPGKDPTRWLPLAQARAHTLLESDNLDDAFRAAAFLSGNIFHGLTLQPRDDDPARTAKRLAAILAQAKSIPNSPGHLYAINNKPVPGPFTRWIVFLADCGPTAAPYAPLVIRLENEIGDSSYLLTAMAKIGSPEIITRLSEILPPLAAQVDAIQHDPTARKGLDARDPRLEKVDTLRGCRLAFDRCAGRSFDTDDQRLAWWAANKSKSPEQWLRDSLPINAARADAHGVGPPWTDLQIFHERLPDAPYGEYESNDTGPPYTQILGQEHEPFRTRWLTDHIAQLTFDPLTATFRLPAIPPK